MVDQYIALAHDGENITRVLGLAFLCQTSRYDGFPGSVFVLAQSQIGYLVAVRQVKQAINLEHILRFQVEFSHQQTTVVFRHLLGHFQTHNGREPALAQLRDRTKDASREFYQSVEGIIQKMDRCQIADADDRLEMIIVFTERSAE